MAAGAVSGASRSGSYQGKESEVLKKMKKIRGENDYGTMKKISLLYFVFVSIMLLFVVEINATTKSKDISISCAYGTTRDCKAH